MIRKFISRGVSDYTHNVERGEIEVWAEDMGDEYHTMHELYQHRLALTVALFKIYDNYETPLRTRVRCWKSKLHSDGTMFEGDYFVVGMTIREWDGKDYQLSYHYTMKHWDKFNIVELPKAPPYDGHTPEDTIKLLLKL